MHPSIQAILFDLDNTLIDRDEALRAYLASAWSPSCQEMDLWLGLDDHGYAQRELLCRAIGQARGVDSERVWGDMRSHISHFVPKRPALWDALDSLNQRMPCGVLSNGSGTNQRAKLERAGLTEVFAPERVWISGDLGVSKPHTEAFAPALEHFRLMGIAPEHVAMVGDDVHRDIIPAQRLGMTTVWVRHHNHWPTPHTPDVVLRDVGDVETWIKAWSH